MYSLVLAKEARLSDDDMETLEFGAFLHDIGKIGVKDAVLLKPGPLDDDEWDHMREHPVKGYEIASKIEMLQPMMPAVRNHHERWDGSGYPDKMVGEDIPLAARIVAIADAFDAMATDRPYKKALPLEECEAVLRKTAGKMYDPELIEVFVYAPPRRAVSRGLRRFAHRRRAARRVVVRLASPDHAKRRGRCYASVYGSNVWHAGRRRSIRVLRGSIAVRAFSDSRQADQEAKGQGALGPQTLGRGPLGGRSRTARARRSRKRPVVPR